MLGHSDIGTADRAEYGDFTVFTGSEIVGQNKTTDFFYNFWKALPHPCRKDIKPAELTRYLDRLVMMDVQWDGDDFALKVRLIGTFVASYYGEISGQDVRVMKNKTATDRIYSVCKTVLEEKAPVLSLTPGISDDQQYLKAFALYMPLFDGAGEVEKIMVCVDVSSRNSTS